MKEFNTSKCVLPVLERWMRVAFWRRGSETRAGAAAAVLAGALAVSVGASFTPSMAMSTLESSCSGMLPISEEKGLGGFSRHISQLVLPVMTEEEVPWSTHSKHELFRYAFIGFNGIKVPDGLRMKISAQP